MEIATTKMSRGSIDNKKTNGQKIRWTPLEDDKLKHLVGQTGPRNWKTIGLHFSGRTGESCRLRWCNHLSPYINKKPFTMEEEERLLKAHWIYGNRWAVIARMFPGRTDVAVRNQYQVTMGRHRRTGSSPAATFPFNQSGYVILSPISSLPWPYNFASAPRSDEFGYSLFSNVHQEIDLERGKWNEMVYHQAATPDHEKNSSGEDETSMIDHGEKRDVPFFDFLGVGLDS